MALEQRWPAADASLLRRLANERALSATALARVTPETARLLYDWYRDGYLHSDAS